jgi:hypothetical protein
LPYLEKQIEKIKDIDKSKRNSTELKQFQQLEDSIHRFDLLRDGFKKIAATTLGL